MAGDNVESYDLDAGATAVAEVGPGISGVVENCEIAASVADLGGPSSPSLDRLRTALSTYRRAVNDRLDDQARVAELVAAMMVGVDQRCRTEGGDG